MHLVFKQNKIILVLVAFVAGIIFALLSKPAYRSVLMQHWQQEFSELTFECDQSMRVHLIAKQKVGNELNKKNMDQLKSSELGLLDCQKYDLFQKKMIRWGLRDNEIGEMVLIAAEGEASSLRKVIQIHEINY